MLQLELYKLFKRKLVWVLLLVLLAYAIYTDITDILGRDNERMQYELEQYEAAKGILTDERLESFYKDYEPARFDDFEDGFLEDGRLKKISEIYPDIDFDLHFGYSSYWAWRLVALGEFMMYVLAFVLVVFSMTFTYERQCGMQEILLYTKNGRRKAVWAKITGAVFTTNIVCLLALVLMLAPVFILTKGVGWDTSVQMTSWMRASQVDVNHLTLIFHTVFLSFMAVNAVLLLTLLISFVAKSSMVALCSTLIVLVVLYPNFLAVSLGNHVIARITSLSPLSVVNILNTIDQKPFQLGNLKIHCLTVAEIIYPLLLAVEGLLLFRIVARKQKYYVS